MCRHIIVLQEKQIVQHLELHNQPSIEDLQYLGHLSVLTLAVLHISFFWLCHSSSCSPCANSTPLFCYFYHVSQVSKFCLFFLFSHLSVFQSSIFTVYLLLSYSYKFSLLYSSFRSCSLRFSHQFWCRVCITMLEFPRFSFSFTSVLIP